MTVAHVLLRDLAGLAGAGLAAYGAWLIYEPAGFITGGALLIAGAVAVARNDVRAQPEKR